MPRPDTAVTVRAHLLQRRDVFAVGYPQQPDELPAHLHRGRLAQHLVDPVLLNGAHIGDRPGQHRDPGQQHPLTQQPRHRPVEQLAARRRRRPHPRRQERPQHLLRRAERPIAQQVPDLPGVLMLGRQPVRVALQTARVRHPDLLGHERRDHRGHLQQDPSGTSPPSAPSPTAPTSPAGWPPAASTPRAMVDSGPPAGLERLPRPDAREASLLGRQKSGEWWLHGVTNLRYVSFLRYVSLLRHL
ncbi:hypothetical protein FRAHR75_1390007 [Frankia sp. Hr75.2]|nr:hypothetical protein FRAHR75_1390007 [Frankia sp. Hr75.2]